MIVRPHPTETLAADMVYSLQILRGIAALLVLGYHYSHYLKPVIPGADLGYRLFAGGYAGVDVFFII
jgi:peptidoglycan/LPS O-acetylase OafA/YrhL